MTNNENLKKQIIYRSTHRGTKEMDMILGNFVKSYIDILKDNELIDLEKILSIEDEIIQKWYFDKKSNNPILNTKVSTMLSNFKLTMNNDS
tara:strand:+ start:1633 stop:1905 length:273 start_codon:yes stop_codon:yes gene_type:complete